MEFSSDKMYFFIETLRRNHVSAVKIHEYLESAWPEDTVSLRHVQRISKEFSDGTRLSFNHSPGQGRPVSDVRKAAIENVNQRIIGDNCLSIRMLVTLTGLPYTMIWRILNDDLQLIWMRTRWVPHVLTDHNRHCRVELCTIMLQSLQSRLVQKNLVVTDEKWFYLRKLQPAKDIGCWLGPEGDRRQTARRSTHDKKLMAIVAVSLRGQHYFEVVDGTVDSDVYINFIRNMGNHFSALPQPLPFENIQLIHDNAKPHVSHATTAFFQEKNIKLIRQPAYSPDTNLCDRFIFARLESIRNRLDFTSKRDLETFLENNMPTFTREMMQKSLEKLTRDLQLIIESEGHYL